MTDWARALERWSGGYLAVYPDGSEVWRENLAGEALVVGRPLSAEPAYVVNQLVAMRDRDDDIPLVRALLDIQ